MNRMIKGYLYVIASAVIFGLMPLGAKIIYANGVNSLSLVFYRNFLALPVIYGILRAGHEPIALGKKDLRAIIILALLGSVATPMLLFSSYNYISSGTSTTLHFVYPAVVIVLEMVLFRTKTSLRSMICVGLCLAGILLFYTPDGNMNLFGVFLAAVSGVVFALYIVLLPRYDLEHLSGFRYTFYLAVVCSVCMFGICIVTGSFTVPQNLLCWSVCIAFSLVLCIGAVVLFRDGTLIVGGQKAAILSTFEPITSVVVGILVFQETLSVRTAIGSVLILAATILIALGDVQKEQT